MTIFFKESGDGKTLEMYSNETNVVLDWDIPYVPERLVDHRAMAVKAYCSFRGIKWQNIENLDEHEGLTERLKYLDNPVYVKIAVKRKEKTKSFSF